ncbi:MAG TPA: transglycosylase family protein, partial [Streptosporangiaceae bacterium]
ALGICIRNAEEGGSYAWGPGNGGGAYQFLLSTWEKYGGAASEYGVASPAYQDQIFDNAIAAGGASNWTAYDGC